VTPPVRQALSVQPPRKSKILIISRHDYRTARKASVHFVARNMADSGHDVSFLSVGYSWLSRLRGDNRSALFHRANRWEEVDGVRSNLWRSTWHPIKLPIPDRMVGWLYSIWARAPFAALDEAARTADLIIVESGIAPALLPRIRAAAPGARIVYRATDLLETAGVPSCIETMLWQSRKDIDIVIVVARAMLDHFDHFDCPRIFIPHGVDMEGLSRTTENPYSGTRNVVSVGSMLFDHTAINMLALAMPHYTFHLIGTPKGKFPDNVIEYGEMSFARTLPYLQHADVGIAAYRRAAASEYLADSSLKLKQYGAIGLPAVCPHFAVGDNSMRFGYAPERPEDIIQAFVRAMNARRQPLPVKDWRDVADELVEVALG
jgi:2-beta-glucuronyltransferase